MNDILQFLAALNTNNNRDWFDANRTWHESSRKAFETFSDELITEVYRFDPSIGILKAKDCTFRIFRDIRFGHDKTPYKINMGVYIARGGRKSIYGGYYFHLEPGGKSFAGGGLYMPPPDNLKMLRQEIFYNVDEFKKILHAKEFSKYYNGLDVMGDELKKAPSGFDPEWPDISLLRYKNYVVGKYMTDAEAGSPEARDSVINAFTALHPLITFINRALEIPHQ